MKDLQWQTVEARVQPDDPAASGKHHLSRFRLNRMRCEGFHSEGLQLYESSHSLPVRKPTFGAQAETPMMILLAIPTQQTPVHH